MTDEQEKLLLRYVPNARKWIASDNLYELELTLDDQIIDIGMDADFELNEIGLVLQRLYDQIHIQNE